MNFDTKLRPDFSCLDQELKELLLSMEQSALLAAQHILHKLRQGPALESWRKFDDTVVTSADIESQSLLVERLKGKLPLVCEEDPESHKLLESESNYFLIDPLDGTTSARRFGDQLGGQVGYGPIIGLVKQNRIFAAVFVNIPMRRAFSAVLGHGCECFSFEDRNKDRVKLPISAEISIDKSALLFFAGRNGELDTLSKLRKSSSIENYYRFGGFGNDASRIALNYEQVQLQYSVKAWDLPAALIPQEVGCKVILNPLGKMQDLKDYRPELENPLLLGQTKIVDQIVSLIREGE